jgi:hypothetical protein
MALEDHRDRTRMNATTTPPATPMIVNNSMEFDWNNKIQLVTGHTDNIMLYRIFSGYFRLNIMFSSRD